MIKIHRSLVLIPSLLAIALSLPSAFAKYDPSKNYIESPEIAKNFPEPNITINTPAFAAGKTDFTSQAEMEAYIEQLSKLSPLMRVRMLAQSQQGRAIPLLIFTDPPLANPEAVVKNGKPTVLLIAQQHGNEPAGGEAALAYAGLLATGQAGDILSKVNILIVPRANPDGAENFTRDLANGFNLNRDHLLLTTPEGRALADVFTEYQPEVVLDGHEFTVASRWIDKFGGVQWADGEIQYSTIANEPKELRVLVESPFRKELLSAFERNNLNHSWYFTTSATNMNDKTVAMGGVGPDTGRNIAGLRNSVSFLLETRGVGIGKANFKRRVYTHLVAIESVVDTTAKNAQLVFDTNRGLRRDVANSAGKGDIIIQSKATPGKNDIRLVDVATGKVKEINVDWVNALEIQSTLSRSRPYGYILAPSEADAAMRLQRLGLEVYRLAANNTMDIPVQKFVVTETKGAVKTDVTGSVGAAGNAGNEVISVKTKLEESKLKLTGDYFYIPLNQPLANLAVVALEPESQSSYVANRLLTLPEAKGNDAVVLPVYRVTQSLPLPLVLVSR